MNNMEKNYIKNRKKEAANICSSTFTLLLLMWLFSIIAGVVLICAGLPTLTTVFGVLACIIHAVVWTCLIALLEDFLLNIKAIRMNLWFAKPWEEPAEKQDETKQE